MGTAARRKGDCCSCKCACDHGRKDTGADCLWYPEFPELYTCSPAVNKTDQSSIFEQHRLQSLIVQFGQQTTFMVLVLPKPAILTVSDYQQFPLF